MATILDAYWIAGAVTGAISGLAFASFFRGNEIASGRLPAYFALCVAAIWNATLDSPMPLSSTAVLATAGILAAAILVTAARPHSRLAGWMEIHPLLFSVMILGPSWFNTEFLDEFSGGILVKRLLVVAFALCLALVAAWMKRFKSWTPLQHTALSLGLLAVSCGAFSLISGGNRALSHSAVPSGPNPKSGPVIVVTWDTTRADHLSVYGYSEDTTPNLEKFVRGATRYTDVTAASDWTLPSHSSIFTGAYPGWHQAYSYSVNPPRIRPLGTQLPTLPQILSAKGYFTAAVVANSAFLLPAWGMARGFHAYDVETPVPVLPTNQPFYLRHGLRAVLGNWFDTDLESTYRRAPEINQNTFALMEQEAVRNRPFFLFVNYMDAHSPYVAPANRKRTLTLWQVWRIQENFYRRHIPVPAAAREELTWRYDAGVREQDSAFAQLMDWLKRRNLYDSALIILTSDHGEAFGDRGRVLHGVGVTQDQVGVPLIVKYPHQKEGSVVTAPVSHVDLMPTVLDTLGYPIPPQVQGVSLRNPEALKDRVLYSESYCNSNFGTSDPSLDRTERALRRGSLKLIQSNKGKRELYDLSSDPEELVNLRSTTPGVAQMEAEFLNWIRTVPKAEPPKDNDQEMRRLKGLGYVR